METDYSKWHPIEHWEKIQTMMYVDGQVIMAKSEDDLQMTVNELNKIVKKYDMKMSHSETKTIRFCGKNKQRIKIEAEGKITEQVNTELQRFNKMKGIIKCHFGEYMKTDTKLRINNITSLSPGGKERPGRDADHSPPSSAEVKKE
jgi:hypothetical protein